MHRHPSQLLKHSAPSATPDDRHTVEAGGATITFLLTRTRRRTIGLTIRDTGLHVTAPQWARLADIREAVIRRRRWIQNRLLERQQFLAQQARADEVWHFGGAIPYMGQLIVLNRAPASQELRFTGKPQAPEAGDQILLPLPAQTCRQPIQDATETWLRHQAQWWLGKRLQAFLHRSGQQIEGWALSSATTRWGSCSSARRIRLNWRLIHFPHALIDYVVAHEVAHLLEMHHGPAFWEVVRTLLPGFEAARQQLRGYRPGIMPFLADP